MTDEELIAEQTKLREASDKCGRLDCPKCGRHEGMNYDARCKWFICLYHGCNHNIKVLSEVELLKLDNHRLTEECERLRGENEVQAAWYKAFGEGAAAIQRISAEHIQLRSSLASAEADRDRLHVEWQKADNLNKALLGRITGGEADRLLKILKDYGEDREEIAQEVSNILAARALKMREPLTRERLERIEKASNIIAQQQQEIESLRQRLAELEGRQGAAAHAPQGVG